jgi:hypothetical protein
MYDLIHCKKTEASCIFGRTEAQLFLKQLALKTKIVLTLFKRINMFIQISDLAQADLLQDLDANDANGVVGGTRIHIPVTPVVLPTVTGTGSTTTIGIASTGPGFGAGIGFGSASGSGFTGSSSVAMASTGANGGSTAGGQGSAFTGGISGVIGGAFDRL